MTSNKNAIRALSRRIDVVEDLLHVLARTWPAPLYKNITNQGETVSSGTLAPDGWARVSVDGSTNDSTHVLRDAHNICASADNKRSNDWHLSTKDAFANLCGGSADFTLIVGHGKPGMISTGSGECIDTLGDDKYMSLQNEQSWSAYVTPAIPGTRLVLFGCYVAAGVAGAKFLQEVANHANMEVGGWTCEPYPGSDGNLHRGGAFLVARPGGSLTPVDCGARYDGKRDIQNLKLRTPDGYQHVPVQSIISVNFTPVGNLPEMPRAFTLEGPQADGLLKLVDFENPVAMPGKLLAIRTGQLTILFQSKKGPQSRVFYLLGDWLLQDALFVNTYYNAAHRLEQVLGQLSRG